MKKINLIALLCISSYIFSSESTRQRQIIPITPTTFALQKALQRERDGSLNIRYNPGAAYNKEIPHHIRGFLFNALKIQKVLDLHQNTPLSDEYRQYLEATFTYNQHIAYQQHRTDALWLQARVGAEVVMAIESACDNSTTPMHPAPQDQQQSYDLPEPADNSLTQETTISPDSMKRPDCKTNTKTSNAPKKVFNGSLICLHRNKKLTRQQTEALRQKAALQSANDRARYKLYKEKNKEIQEQLEKAEKRRRQEQSEKDKTNQLMQQALKIAQEKTENEEKLFLAQLAEEIERRRYENAYMQREDILSELQIKMEKYTAALEKEKLRSLQQEKMHQDMLIKEQIRAEQIKAIVDRAQAIRLQQQEIIQDTCAEFINSENKQNLNASLFSVIKQMAIEEKIDHPKLDRIITDHIIAVGLQDARKHHRQVIKLRSSIIEKQPQDQDEKQTRQEYLQYKLEGYKKYLQQQYALPSKTQLFCSHKYSSVLSQAMNLLYPVDKKLTSQDQLRTDA